MNTHTVEELYRLAQQGNTEALTRLGICYKNGTGTAVDHGAAALCFYSAANAGNAEAQYQLSICYEEGIEVTSLPGPAACITALTMSGQPTRRFAFEAFLPREKKERAAVLSQLVNETRTIIIYEAPHHLIRTLEELYEPLGERKLTVCRELPKRYEEKTLTTFSEILQYYKVNDPRGEYVLVIAGKTFEELKQEEQRNWENLSLEEHMEVYEKQGISRKEAMKLVAKDRGISRRDVYQALLS